MNSLSNLLFLITILAVLYIINWRIIKPPLFSLREISVYGMNEIQTSNGPLQRVTREQIEQIVRNEIVGNFFTVDLTAVRQAFIKLPWVRDTKMQRDWPHGLKVMIEEHAVLAHWGSHALVNTYGEIFRAEIDEKLPSFSGPMKENSHEVAQQYARLSQLLAPLQQRIAEINLSPRHAWRIRLETGTVLELGREKIEARLARYTSVYNHNIAPLSQQEPLAYMDLRYPNGFAVRLPEAMQQTPRKPLWRREENVKLGEVAK